MDAGLPERSRPSCCTASARASARNPTEIAPKTRSPVQNRKPVFNSGQPNQPASCTPRPRPSVLEPTGPALYLLVLGRDNTIVQLSVSNPGVVFRLLQTAHS